MRHKHQLYLHPILILSCAHRQASAIAQIAHLVAHQALISAHQVGRGQGNRILAGRQTFLPKERISATQKER